MRIIIRGKLLLLNTEKDKGEYTELTKLEV